ncbi:MAG: ATP-binding protein, partial [Actinomycetes bacterium]
MSVIRGPKETALAVVGGKGLGKSALLSGVPALSDYRTIFMSATAAESSWPLSGLTALLNDMQDPLLSPVLDELLRDSTGSMGVPAASHMLLDALHKRASPRTVIVVDDADHLDAASQAVLGFVARRLAGTDIIFIV